MQGLIFGLFICIYLSTSAHGAVTETLVAKYRGEVLDRHNFYRKQYCAKDVQRNATLEQEAQAYCEKMAQTGNFAHSNRTDAGESSYQHTPFDFTKLGGYTPVDYWAAERVNYTVTKANETLHFTQLVWKNTTTIGVGVCDVPNNGAMFVVLYFPRGNYEGLFAHNVGCS